MYDNLYHATDVVFEPGDIIETRSAFGMLTPEGVDFKYWCVYLIDEPVFHYTMVARLFKRHYIYKVSTEGKIETDTLWDGLVSDSNCVVLEKVDSIKLPKKELKKYLYLEYTENKKLHDWMIKNRIGPINADRFKYNAK